MGGVFGYPGGRRPGHLLRRQVPPRRLLGDELQDGRARWPSGSHGQGRSRRCSSPSPASRSPCPPPCRATSWATSTAAGAGCRAPTPADGGRQVITALVPTSEIQRYAVDLRSITGGRGRFRAEHDHYDVMPANLAERMTKVKVRQTAEAGDGRPRHRPRRRRRRTTPWRPLIADYQRFYGVDDPDDTAQPRPSSPAFSARATPVACSGRGDDGRLLGYACLYYTASSVEAEDIIILNDLYVVPDARGSGVGRRLIEATTETARTRNIRRVRWSTALDNRRAQRLYETDGGAALDLVRVRSSRRPVGAGRRRPHRQPDGQAPCTLRQLSGSVSGMTRTPATVVMKLVSPVHRGRTWRWRWRGIPAPAARPRLAPMLNPSGCRPCSRAAHGRRVASHRSPDSAPASARPAPTRGGWA